MNEYRVTWEIDLEADDAVAAAWQARRMQLRSDSIATVFDVTLTRLGMQHVSNEPTVQIDLLED